MLKKTLIIIALMTLAFTLGCSSGTSTTEKTTPANLKIVRETKIGSEWMMRQVEINLETEFTVVIELSDGGKVDGYFYLERGNNIDFQISGTSLIYESQPPDTKTTLINSDRFTFTASQAQGIAYNLKFKSNPTAGGSSRQTVFLEIIYPVTGLVTVPLGTR
jgi:hypothetical protein